MIEMTELIELIRKLTDATDELAEATLNEFRSEKGHNESIEAIFELAKLMRKEKAATEAATQI